MTGLLSIPGHCILISDKYPWVCDRNLLASDKNNFVPVKNHLRKGKMELTSKLYSMKTEHDITIMNKTHKTCAVCEQYLIYNNNERLVLNSA
jgi:hypothetical protein